MTPKRRNAASAAPAVVANSDASTTKNIHAVDCPPKSKKLKCMSDDSTTVSSNVAMTDGSMITTWFPCPKCKRLFKAAGVAHACESFPVSKHFSSGGRKSLQSVWEALAARLSEIGDDVRVDSQRCSINLFGPTKCFSRIQVQAVALKVTWLSKNQWSTQSDNDLVQSTMCHCKLCEAGTNTWKNAIKLSCTNDVGDKLMQDLSCIYREKNFS